MHNCNQILEKEMYFFWHQTIDNVKNSNKTNMQFGTRDSNFDKQF